MDNYYNVVNAASRLNCNRQTVLRAIKDGTFTNAIQDYSIPGTPGWLIPSDQVEWWKDHGGILKRKSWKTGQSAGGVAKMLVHQDGTTFETTQQKIEEMQKEVNDMLGDKNQVGINEAYAHLGIGWLPEQLHDRDRIDLNLNKDAGKILIEIDASTIQKSVSDQFRRQIANLREAVNLISDELTKLEAML